MKDVHTWLKEPKKIYSEGVEILQFHSPKEAVFYAAEKNPPPDGYHFRMLIKKLQNIARVQLQNHKANEPAVKKIIVVNELPQTDPSPAKSTIAGRNISKSPSMTIIPANPTVEFNKLPEDLKKKYLQNKEMNSRISDKHKQLKEPSLNNDERKKILDELISLQKQVKSNWTAIDKWWNSNEKPQPVAAPNHEADIAEAAVKRMKRIEGLKINISRARREIEKDPKHKTAAKKKEKIAIWQKELNDLQKG